MPHRARRAETKSYPTSHTPVILGDSVPTLEHTNAIVRDPLGGGGGYILWSHKQICSEQVREGF